MSTTKIRSFDDILALFPESPRQKILDGWNVICPAHQDKNPSLSVTLKANKILVNCQAGCKTEDVLKLKGLILADLFLDSNHRPEDNKQKTLVATFNYECEKGKEAYQIRRFDLGNGNKTFEAWHKKDGQYISGMGEYKDKPILYHLPKIPEWKATGRRIYLPEGEGKVDPIVAQGGAASTSPFGAGPKKWRAEYSETLAGAEVIILPDNDKPGRDFAQAKAASLYGIAKSIKILELPGLPEKGDIIDWFNAGGTFGQLERLANEAPEWKPAPEEELGGLLADVERFISLYVSTGGAERTALALWVAHTHAIEAAECTPYLYVTSPEKQSGKTRLLEVLALLVAHPWFTARVSAAVLVRKVSRDAPTLLLDEIDSAFKADKEYSEALRGLLNAGYRRGGVASLCIKKGGDFDLVDFPVFCAKVLSGIGQLPDTVADRSIRINMKRRSPDEPVERFRLRAAQAQASPLRDRLEQWANVAVTRLADARPVLPEELSDRSADVWEPLFAEADMAGGEWPSRSRQAAGVLSSHADDDGLSWGAQLLRDIALVLDGREGPVPSGELVTALVEREESPWGDLRGRPLDARKLARMLRPYGIRPHTVRLGNATPKGYQAEDFGDAFTRYIPRIAATTATQDTPKANSGPGLVADVADVADKKGIRADDDTPPPPGDLKHNELPDYPTSPCHICSCSDYWLTDWNKWLCSRCYPKPGGES